MPEKRTCTDCRRLTSYILLCPHKDDEAIRNLRKRFLIDSRSSALSSKVSEALEKLACECQYFERERR